MSSLELFAELGNGFRCILLAGLVGLFVGSFRRASAMAGLMWIGKLHPLVSKCSYCILPISIRASSFMQPVRAQLKLLLQEALGMGHCLFDFSLRLFCSICLFPQRLEFRESFINILDSLSDSLRIFHYRIGSKLMLQVLHLDNSSMCCRKFGL